jgi:ATP-dependent Lhr-like helicase
LALRYARTHAPFPAIEFGVRYGLTAQAAEGVLLRLTAEGRLIEGEFRPGGTRREWTDAGVLRMLRRRSLARLRQEVEPVDQAVLGRFATTWQGIVKPRTGADALLDAVEQLQGAAVPASILETEILPARVEFYDPADLDAITAAGEVVWVGVEPLGERDGRIALYLADHLPRLLPPAGGQSDRELTERERAILDLLRSRGASFFAPLHEAAGGGYPAETVDALWALVWRGLVTNDTFHALRGYTRARVTRRQMRRTRPVQGFRSRRLAPQSAEGRWTLVRAIPKDRPNTTKWAAAVTQQLLTRHGVLTREALNVESVPGGFGVVYPVLKQLEDTGRIRRGYFVAGLGATQFALPGALDLLRSLRDRPEEGELESVLLSATDPANPYGTMLKWPPSSADAAKAGRAPTRSVGATVVLVSGRLAAYLSRGDRQLTMYLPESEPERSRHASAVARALVERARSPADAPRGMLIEEIDGAPAVSHAMVRRFVDAGFVAGAMGLQADLRSRRALVASRESEPPQSVADPEPEPPVSATGSDARISGGRVSARRRSRSTISSPFSARYLKDDAPDESE